MWLFNLGQLKSSNRRKAGCGRDGLGSEVEELDLGTRCGCESLGTFEADRAGTTDGQCLEVSCSLSNEGKVGVGDGIDVGEALELEGADVFKVDFLVEEWELVNLIFWNQLSKSHVDGVELERGEAGEGKKVSPFGGGEEAEG
jgi:hypothetical protein